MFRRRELGAEIGIGLARTPSVPAAKKSARSALLSLAVRARTGIGKISFQPGILIRLDSSRSYRIRLS